MRVTVGLLALAVFAVLTGPALAQSRVTGAAPAGPDSMFLGDPSHSGGSPAQLTVPLVLSWKHTVEPNTDNVEHVVASPAYDDDTVYFFVGNNMYAVWKDSGAKKWDAPLALPDRVDSTPLIKDGVAVFGCRNGIVYFVELGAKSGSFAGEFNIAREHTKLPKSPEEQAIPPRVQSSPLYHDGKVYFGASDGWVYALDMASQKKIWDFRTKGPIVSSPAYWNRGVYVASLDGSVYGLSEDTGKLVWQTTLENKDLLVSPVITRSKVFAAAGKHLYACDHGRNGYVRMRFEAKGNIVGTPTVAGNAIIFGDSEDKLYALDIRATGNISYHDVNSEYILWQLPPEESDGQGAEKPAVPTDGFQQPVKSTPLVAGDAVIYRSGPRQINAVSIEDGSTLWHYQLAELAGQETTEDQAAAALAQVTEAARLSAMAGTGTTAGAGGFGGFGGRTGGTSRFSRGGLTRSGFGAAGGYYYDEYGRAVAPTLVFEYEVQASPVADGDNLYVLGNDRALYAFSQKAADAVGPELEEAEIEVPGAGEQRTQQNLALYVGVDEIKPETEKPKIRGALPVYVRMVAYDAGSGIDPQTISASLVSGDEDVRWEVAYDAAGAYLWLICEQYRGSRSRNMPDGDYVVAVSVSDWMGNESTRHFAFTVDRKLPAAPAPTAGGFQRGGFGAPGGGMPGGMPGMMPGGMPEPIPGMPGMMPGGMPEPIPGMPGGMPVMPGGMPGMPGGMPGMPGGMPGMPGGMPGMPGGMSGMPGLPGM
ncbi:MAG: PQQ-binding-like beta-propeller repeat protein [Armatimonadetes bacterium]|nr:PQQ-binding-like beta-propeller repeat protein [Armatimonadota bacterium]